MEAKGIKKIDKELKPDKLTQKGKAVCDEVVKTLKQFCKQNAEFAQAVEQSSKKVNECIEATVCNTKGSISDLEVYKRAVKFYFPGAKVKCELSIDVGDNGFSNNQSAEDKPILLTLDSLLDF